MEPDAPLRCADPRDDPAPISRTAPSLRDRLDDRGASVVEYALLISLIFVVALSAISYFADAASDTMYDTADAICNATHEDADNC